MKKRVFEGCQVVGSNLSGVSAVGFGGVPTPFVVDSPTQIRAFAGTGANGVISLITPSGVVASALPITFSNAPGVTSIAPNYGTTGSTVQISGLRLSGAIAVRIGGVPVQRFTVNSPTQISAVLDGGATGDVIVQTPNGIGTLTGAFTFYRSPSVLDVTPKIVRPADTVRVSGGEFVGVQRVSIGGRSVSSFTVLSTTSILVIVPQGAVNGRIGVQNIVGSDSSQAELLILYPPTISAVNPTIAAPNQVLTVFGSEFHPLTTVRIGATTTSTLTRISMNQLQCAFAQATTGALTVISSGGTVSTVFPVSIVVPPVIHGFQPAEPLQGQAITVTGANFLLVGTSVRVGGIPVQATVNSSTSITLIIPPNVQGAITVQTAAGAVTTASVIRPIPPPSIVMLNPQRGQVGSIVEIRGVNFQQTQNVSIGGVRASFEVNAEGTIIRAIVPSFGQNGSFQAASEATVRVATRGGTASAALSFTVLPPPGSILTGFQPMSLSEGEELSIVGVNIPPNARIFLNGIEVTTASVQTSSSITLRVPLGIVPPQAFSTNVVVTLVSGTASTNAALTLVLMGANLPGITDFTPNIGGRETVMTLTGQNLGIEPRGVIRGVRIGGIPVRSFTVLSPSTMQIIVGNVRTGIVTLETSSGELSTRRVFEFDSTIVPIPPTLAQDSIALERLYAATKGDNWTTNATWRNRAPIATRFGVRVENSRVVELRLPANNLDGEIAPEIFSALTMLRLLDVRGNRLSGDIAALRGAIHLQAVDVANNRLSGNIEAICALRSMETLNLAQNRLSGGLPSCLAEWKMLRVLDASDNQLSGSLPSNMGNAESLQSLILRGNRFTGAIPSEWGNSKILAKKAVSGLTSALTMLRLDLSQNQLSDTLPETLGNMRNLRELRLNNNRLVGNIPSS
ncbi:MAG: IPT/TIG domain-containing protein, partial [Candidatus Kapaibacteriota bacterium]